MRGSKIGGGRGADFVTAQRTTAAKTEAAPLSITMIPSRAPSVELLNRV